MFVSKEAEESYPIDKVLDDYYAGKLNTTKLVTEEDIDKYLNNLNEN